MPSPFKSSRFRAWLALPAWQAVVLSGALNEYSDLQGAVRILASQRRSANRHHQVERRLRYQGWVLENARLSRNYNFKGQDRASRARGPWNYLARARDWRRKAIARGNMKMRSAPARSLINRNSNRVFVWIRDPNLARLLDQLRSRGASCLGVKARGKVRILYPARQHCFAAADRGKNAIALKNLRRNGRETTTIRGTVPRDSTIYESTGTASQRKQTRSGIPAASRDPRAWCVMAKPKP